MPDAKKLEDDADDMEERLHRLEDQIDDAAKKAAVKGEGSDVAQDVAGDWEDEQDRGGGDDPKGAGAASG